MMSNRESGGDYNAASERRIDNEDESPPAEPDETSGSAASDKTVAGLTSLWETDAPQAQRVLRHLLKETTETTFYKSADVAEELDITTKQAAHALRAIADADTRHISVEQWTNTTTPTTWRVTLPDPGSPERRLTEAAKQLTLASADIDDAEAVAELAGALGAIERAESALADEEVVTDGGWEDVGTLPPEKEPEYVGAHSGAESVECRNWLEPNADGQCGAPATHTVVMYHGELSEIPMCNGCGEPEDVDAWDREWSAEEPDAVTDGGEQFYVVDEDRRRIVAGPFPDRVTAQADERARQPAHIVVSGRALDLARQDGPIRDETGDVDVVTDGGTIPVCPACDRTNICPSARSQGWYCKDCKETFTDPPRRESRQETGLPSAEAQALDDMDPEEFDELLTDGGQIVTVKTAGDDFARCITCGATGETPDTVDHHDSCSGGED